MESIDMSTTAQRPEAAKPAKKKDDAAVAPEAWSDEESAKVQERNLI